MGGGRGTLALVEHSAPFRAHVGDAAATYCDVQGAIAPWCVVGAVVTLLSQARGLARAVAARTVAPSPAAPAGQVPVGD